MKRKASKGKSCDKLRENLKLHVPTDYGWRALYALVEDLNHLLTDSENSTLHGIIRNRDYAGYLELSELWGPQCIYLRDRPLAEMRAVYQVVSLLKKFRFPSDDVARRTAAKQKMLAAEDVCAQYNRDGWIGLAWTEDERMRNAYTYARAFLQKLLGFELPSETQMTLWSRHGPGANLDTKLGRTSQYFKYSDWPYSCTKGALPEARAAIQNDERWLGALEDSYRERNQIPKTAILNRTAFWSAVINVVPGNRIAFVPKNSQTDRSIAIEPSLNLYLQLGVDGFIRKRLKRWGVDLDSQKKNQELARLGSLNWEDPENFVTLDLASASDTISLSLCEALLPKLWYNHLINLRSPSGDLDGETISYEKISSMGNGFTFALETAIFTSLVYGVSREFLGHFNKEECAIYGDDIIVKSTIASEVVKILNLSGFTINSEKSFIEGPFRESCGADWFRGHGVRPVFFTSAPTSVMELWTDINRLRRILSLRFMEFESKTESLLARWIPSIFKGIRGPASDEDFDSYWHSDKPPVKAVYAHCLWKYKRLVVKPKPVRGQNFLFRKLMHDLREQVVPECRFSQKSWKGAQITSAGSRFIVTKPFSVTVGYTYSVADIWRSEYTEF